jgi:hypothetical protein
MNERIQQFINPQFFKFVYIFVAIITFGHAWANIMSTLGVAFSLEFWYFKAILTSVTSLCWPLYWSIWLWS